MTTTRTNISIHCNNQTVANWRGLLSRATGQMSGGIVVRVGSVDYYCDERSAVTLRAHLQDVVKGIEDQFDIVDLKPTTPDYRDDLVRILTNTVDRITATQA